MELEFHLYQEAWGEEPVLGFELGKLSRRERDLALGRNAELMVKTASRFGHDAIKDIGLYWELSPGLPAYLWFPESVDQLDQVRALRREAGDEFFLLGSCSPTMCLPDGEHFESFCMDLFENPDDVKSGCQAALEKALIKQDQLLEAGADGILNASDMAFNTGLFISPAMMEEFFYPYLEAWAGSLKKLGVISIWHSDGDISMALDRAVECGVSAIQCVDPIAGMDIGAVRKKYENRLSVIGNLDCSILHEGTPEEVEEKSREILEACKGGGFAFSGCNAIFKGIPLENYQAMVDARWKYGKLGGA
jgi:uroporphyrinogen decarboxylase